MRFRSRPPRPSSKSASTIAATVELCSSLPSGLVFTLPPESFRVKPRASRKRLKPSTVP